MSGQLNMEEYFGDKIIESLGEPHLACVFLLDVSESMKGQVMDNLNAAMQSLREQVVAHAVDPLIKERVDLAIITFGSEIEVIREFEPISAMSELPQLHAEGCAEMAKGIQKAIDLVNERLKFYSMLGVCCYKPHIFMITDGVVSSSPKEMEKATLRIQLEESKVSHGHLSFWALGIGDYDKEQLFSVTNRVMELIDINFMEIIEWLFDWVTASRVFSDERIGVDPLPSNVRSLKKCDTSIINEKRRIQK